ncbi:MAG: hypothetical protein H0W71_10030 [Sphingomonas sp.]|nr:hypothetical protein [Sphingomonas sp.]
MRIVEVFTGDMASNGIDDRTESRIGAVALPAPQRKCLHLTEAKRRINRVEADRQIDPATLRSSGFVADEITIAAD